MQQLVNAILQDDYFFAKIGKLNVIIFIYETEGVTCRHMWNIFRHMDRNMCI